MKKITKRILLCVCTLILFSSVLWMEGSTCEARTITSWILDSKPKAEETTTETTNHALIVIGSYADPSGSGNFDQGKQVSIHAGSRTGYTFEGWILSDGRTFSDNNVTFTMPNETVLVFAKWNFRGGVLKTVQSVTTTNLKGSQLGDWNSIALKLDTLTPNDLNDGSTANVLGVKVVGLGCNIDSTVIQHLNVRQATAMNLFYLTDTNFTFFSDLDNSQFTGTDLTYTSTVTTKTSLIHEKTIRFENPGAIGTAISINTYLPNSVPGQTSYVYVMLNKKPVLYTAVVVDANNYISFPVIGKTEFIIQY